MSLSSTIGKGLLAGVAGTAAMTLSTVVESKLSQRPPSTAPAEAVEKVVGVEPEDEEAEHRLSTVSHWAYGTGWGVPRAALGAAGMSGPLATMAHFFLVWGSALVMLPALGIAPPVNRWKREDTVKDALHHAVYAVAAGVAYALLDRRERRREAA
jgi:hypothetical protein